MNYQIKLLELLTLNGYKNNYGVKYVVTFIRSNLRTVLIQLCKYKDDMQGVKDETKLKALFLDEKTDSVLRQNIVWVLSDDEESLEALKTVAYGTDELLAFQAIKRLNNSLPETARKIANEILQTKNINTEQSEKLRIARNLLEI